MSSSNNMSKNPFYTFISLLLLILIILIGAGVFIYNRNTQVLSSLPITEKLSQKLKPESARIKLHIRLSGTDLDKMNVEINQKATSIQEYVVAQGLDKDKIKTNVNSYSDYNYNIYPVQGTPKSDIVPTVLDKSIELYFDKISQNPKKPTEILNETIKRGVTQFEAFTYETPDLENVCNDLKTQVQSKAMETAKKNVSAIGGKLVKIEAQGITSTGCDNDYRGVTSMYAKDATTTSAEPAKSAPELLTGETEITVYSNLIALYSIK